MSLIQIFISCIPNNNTNSSNVQLQIYNLVSVNFNVSHMQAAQASRKSSNEPVRIINGNVRCHGKLVLIDLRKKDEAGDH